MQAQHRIMTKEATQSYAKERRRFSHLFSPIMHGVMAEGDAVSRRQYADAQEAQAPRAGPSRRGLGASSTSCWRRRPRARRRRAWAIPAIPIFNRFWTLLGTPCIALPFNTGPFGLPLSVQLDRPARRGRPADRLGALGGAQALVTLKLGLIGYGAIGKHVEAALKAGSIENLELVAALVKRPRAMTGLLTHEPDRFFAHQVRRRRRMRRPRGRAQPRPARPRARRGPARDLGRRLHRHRPVRSPAGRGQGRTASA